MKHSEFNEILSDQMEKCSRVLSSKAKEYAGDEDRLANFKAAAALRGCSQAQAVHGMMVKHTVSVADMVEGGESFTLEQWEEKIGDNLNYLFLLKAAIIEDDKLKPHPTLFDNHAN